MLTISFSGRASYYAQYRPKYPDGIINLLRNDVPIGPNCRVVDVGSGAGCSSELWLKHGCAVIGIEPDDTMRNTAELRLRDYSQFCSIAASAEAVPLSQDIADVVMAATSYQWFDTQRTRDEFFRILRPGGTMLLLWNSRRKRTSPFTIDYESLVQEFTADYEVRPRIDAISNEIRAQCLFGNRGFRTAAFEHSQSLDFNGLVGKLLSSPYAPQLGNEMYSPMLTRLRRIFVHHERSGSIEFQYDTFMYWGRLK